MHLSKIYIRFRETLFICATSRVNKRNLLFYLTISVVHEVATMTKIRDLAQQALQTGYLTMAAEEQLRQLLSTRYELEDFNAFMSLQQAAMLGQVKQESRERLKVMI